MKDLLFRGLKCRRLKSAFSLVELSVIIMILSIVVAGILSTMVSDVTNKKAKTSNRNINNIYKSLTNHLAVNKRLPCPASFKIALSSTSYGLEDAGAGTCLTGTGVYLINTGYTDFVYGMVPVATLGLDKESSQDGFGNKIAYVVMTSFTAATPNLITLTGDIIVSKYIGGVDADAQSDVVFLLISHGPNNNGAFTYNSIVQNSVNSADTPELRNIITTTDDNNATIPTPSNFINYVSGSSTFDDNIFYRNKDILMNDARISPLASSNFFTGEMQ